ncbi:hypothetical protein NEDG_00541 [Nematocida displodere]|uniref:Uncharacterized protein n=1 Tax=Nematocida displodere TaxID=1805483 RepID=A0A177EC59_9MICR|nr:hypothetical protein NEDG_00541 [Nematocida displodere]
MKEHGTVLGLLNTEFVRYAVGRVSSAACLSLGLRSEGALSHMHSSRILLTAQEIAESWSSSGLDRMEVLTKTASIVSSTAAVCTGFSSFFRIAESLYLLLETAGSASTFLKVKRARETVPDGKEINRMYATSALVLGCNAVECFSFALGIWPVYLVAALCRGLITLWGCYGGIGEKVRGLIDKYTGASKRRPHNESKRTFFMP